MSPKEEASLRQLYSTWPLERLARAASVEKQQYTPEAVAIMLVELEQRGLATDSVAKFASTVPPSLPSGPGRVLVTDTWLLPARLDRRQYRIRAASVVFGTVALAVLLEFIPFLQPASFVILAVSSFLYCALGLLLPRCRDAGVPSGMAIVFALFPFTAFLTFFVLFFIPSKAEDGSAKQLPETPAGAPVSVDQPKATRP
ncbi:hypothetical protein ESB00_05090 [Oleiharenicola lentus]|uniref:DUF805 domain-containing protein n=1 Tax=Oleiharenicola lentus TaxID=2508720 RepID=A0A4Q1C8J8_9BACT|nr:DUF805 domain-containing protein [Oleiharenicola lentus]RXK55275.1 hypothetical protein ESB00_05090 [Oleiharenicola lentus]